MALWAGHGRPENVMLYLQRPMGVAWPLLLPALCRCPLAPLASWDAQKCLHPEKASEVRTSCQKLSLWQAQQMSQGMQRTLARHSWGAAQCWARRGSARRPEMARTGALGRRPDQVPPRGSEGSRSREGGYGSGRQLRGAPQRLVEDEGCKGIAGWGWAGLEGMSRELPRPPPGAACLKSRLSTS